MKTSETVIQLTFSVLFVLIAVFGMVFPDMKKAKAESNSIKAAFKRKKTEYFYFIAVLATVIGISCMLIFYYGNLSVIQSLKRIALITILSVAAYYDRAAFRIPNKLIIYGLALRVCFVVLEILFEREVLKETLLSDGIAAVGLLIISLLCLLITKNGLGMGDVKLFFLMGLMQGIQGVLSSVFASLIVSFFVAVYLLLRKKKQRKDFIPFAPCIFIGTVISVIMTGM